MLRHIQDRGQFSGSQNWFRRGVQCGSKAAFLPIIGQEAKKNFTARQGSKGVLNMKKRLISMLTTVTMLFSCTMVASANDIGTFMDAEKKELLIYEAENEVFMKVQEKGIDNFIRVTQDNNYENIYCSTEKDVYFQKINDNEFVEVKKVEFQLTDYENYQNIQRYKMPKEVLEGIASMAAFAQENNNTDARCVIFVAENEANNQLNTLPMVTTKKDGYTFHHYEVYFTDMWTSWQTVSEKGATTRGNLEAIKELVMFVVGEAKEKIGIAYTLFNAGRNCLEAWQLETGRTPIYGNSNNKVMMDINYDIYLKYTFNYNPVRGETHGCSTQKVIVKQVDTDTYLYTSQGGARNEETEKKNQEYYTPNYKNPESEALLYIGGITGSVERAEGEVNDVLVYFTFPEFTWPSDWP